jgi:SWI/SNF-related matrix-associated actin-dependent regulator of chromatin subfamily B protein 1
MKLDDQFEWELWDIESPGASPEQFVEVYTQELGLGSEFW